MKPILFNTDMVRAILEGRKTVTRRVMKPQPVGQPAQMGEDSCWPGYFAIQGTEKVIQPPFCAGDVIWVRETFQVDYLSNISGSGRVQYKSDGAYQDFSFSPERYEIMRRAQRKPGWRPNENMPREAARIFLRVTGVRVERLQDVKYFDCLAEGIPYRQMETDIVQDFATLWDSTIKPADRAAYGWGVNPWVWVISFERAKEIGP